MRVWLRRRIDAWILGARMEPDVRAAEPVAGNPLTRLLRRIEPYLGSNRRLVLVLGFVSLLSGFAEATLIFLLLRSAASLAADGGALDVAIGPFDTDLSTTASITIAAGAVALTFALNALAAVITAQLTVASLSRARRRTIRAFVNAGWEVQSAEDLGQLQELLTNNVNKVAQGVLAITTGVTSALSFTALMVSAVIIQPLAAGAILAAVLGVGLLLFPLARMTKRRSAENRDRSLAYASQVAETVDLAREIDVFGVWDEVADTMGRRADEVTRSSFLTRVLMRLSPAIYQATVLGLLVVGMAVLEAVDPSDVANLGSVVVLLVRAVSYGQQLNSAVQQASEIAPFVERLEERELFYSARERPSGTEPLPTVRSIRLESVSYEYEPDQPVIAGISLDIKIGEVIGIVGPSGSGKSTLIQLLLGLRTPTSGHYLVNGHHVDEIDRADWARRFALVPQDNRVLRASVAENVRFHRDDVTGADVDRALELAHLRDDVLALPGGPDAEIGQGARDLSGGQLQRLGLARALARRPDVLVLDEPTSALDMTSEALIQSSLNELKGSLTIVVIAHRLTTLSICDRIVVLEGGRTSAVGTFADLQTQSPFFKNAVALSRLPA